jgi:hypothetical protein
MINLRRKFQEFVTWAKKSWTVWFNVFVALFGIFSETFVQLEYAINPKVYAALFILVPMVNFFLRMKTQKAHAKAVQLAGSDNEAGL